MSVLVFVTCYMYMYIHFRKLPPWQKPISPGENTAALVRKKIQKQYVSGGTYNVCQYVTFSLFQSKVVIAKAISGSIVISFLGKSYRFFLSIRPPAYKTMVTVSGSTGKIPYIRPWSYIVRFFWNLEFVCSKYSFN